MKSVKIGLLLAFLGLAALVPPLAGAADPGPVFSEQKDRVGLNLTVYNRNLALVRETRDVRLPGGPFTLEYRDVPSAIRPATLLVEGGAKIELVLFDQNYEYDLMTPEKVMEKYVGRPVAWILEDGSRREGRLLGLNGKPVWEVDGNIMFDVPGRLVLPDLPADLRARPTLVWNGSSRSGGQTRLETSYLTGGLDWHCDYVLQLDKSGQEAGLQAWVTLDNHSGAAFGQARLQLVAGDLNLVTGPRDRPVAMEISDKLRAARASSFQEETLYDYHLYTLDRPVDLKDNQTKQVSLFEKEGIAITSRYRLDGAPQYYRGLGRLEGNEKVRVYYAFDNRQSNGLGIPMPAGTIRIYGQAASGGRQLLGEDRVEHTPKDEEIELLAGNAFDIVAERVRLKAEKIGSSTWRTTMRVTLRNHKGDDVEVDVREPVSGDWNLLESTYPGQRLSAGELGFKVPVPAGK